MLHSLNYSPKHYFRNSALNFVFEFVSTPAESWQKSIEVKIPASCFQSSHSSGKDEPGFCIARFWGERL